jgi:hypothetical protein
MKQTKPPKLCKDGKKAFVIINGKKHYLTGNGVVQKSKPPTPDSSWSGGKTPDAQSKKFLFCTMTKMSL